jgi:hypothetical protein
MNDGLFDRGIKKCRPLTSDDRADTYARTQVFGPVQMPTQHLHIATDKRASKAAGRDQLPGSAVFLRACPLLRWGESIVRWQVCTRP